METLRRLFLLSLMVVVCLIAWPQRIAVLSDTHVSPGNANEQQLRLAIDEINASSFDAVIHSGDLTNQGADDELRNIKSLLDEVRHPLYVVPGNHENNWSQSACKTFNDLWGNDRFAFTVDSLVVVGLNCGPFMKMGDGHIKQEDLHWLDSTLCVTVRPGMKVLSVNHYPLLDDLDNYRDYVAILKKYPVITHQNGHYHRWCLYETDGIAGLMVRALDMGNGDYGYSIIDYDHHRGVMRVFEKRIGHEPELRYAYKVNTTFDNAQPPLDPPVVATDDTLARIVVNGVASIFTRVAVDERNVYYGTSTGNVVAADKITGECRWQVHTASMLFSRPAVFGKCVIMPTGDSRLLWIDKKTGKVAYERKATGPYVADGLIKDGILYQGGYKTFEAWDAKRHRLLWRYDSIDNYCQAAPVVCGNDIVFGAWDTRLRVLDRRDGRLRWQWDNGRSARLLSPGNVVPVVNGNHVLIVAPDRVATCLDRRDGRQVWREKNELKVRESLGSSADGAVAYAKTMDGELIAMDATAGEYRLLWREDAGFGYEHAPCPVLEHRGRIYTGSRRGMVAVFDAATHRLLYRLRLGSSEVNGFEVDPATGSVYCSLIEGKIYRLN